MRRRWGYWPATYTSIICKIHHGKWETGQNTRITGLTWGPPGAQKRAPYWPHEYCYRDMKEHYSNRNSLFFAFFLSITRCTLHFDADAPERRIINRSDMHDDIIKWKHFLRYWPCVRDIHRSPVYSPHKGQWCEFWCFLWPTTEQTVQLTIETPVIRDGITLIMTSL